MRNAIIIAGLLIASTGLAQAQYGYGSTNRGSSFGSNGGYGTGSNSNSNTVNPYVRQDGGYVAGHQRTNPNNSQLDNYGTRGNYNPYSGQTGKRSPSGW